MITVHNLKKIFGNTLIFDNLSFHIENESICSIIGPSGCGKTTLLNMLMGLDEATSGSIQFGDDTHSANSKGYMMQEAPLLPWRTLEENALLGAEVKNAEKQPALETLDNYFSSFDLSSSRGSYPCESSGGMKQRVALIRTLLVNPTTILLDEPFSNLDFDIKLKIQTHLIKYFYKQKASILLITHDIEDAIALSDKIIILSEKPTRIKLELCINLGLSRKDPIEARKSLQFRDYFIKVWNELKYLKESNTNHQASAL